MNAFIETPPEGVEGWRRVWRENLRYRIEEPASALKRRLRGWIRRVVRSVSREEDERQRNFNLAALEIFEDLRRDQESFRGDLAALGIELQKFRELLPVAVQRNDALVAALDQKIETVAVRIRDITTRLLSATEVTPGVRNDFLYRRLEDGLRGSGSEVRQRMQPYLEYARKASPVIDAGCGRGEFLELCREAGIPARGFDSNERSVATLKERGFDVALGGIPDWLDELQPGTTGSILAAHVVEHLPAEPLFSFFGGAARALRSGGYLMIETPNAQSLAISGSDFWRDPTHLGPRHAGALTLLAREFGFEVEELRTVNEFPDARLFRAKEQSLMNLVDQLNEVIYGKQDLRLILRKI